MSKKINFAVVGCGRHGRKRALSIKKKAALARVTKVFDIDPSQSSRLAMELDVPAALSFESIYLDREIDVVVVAVPNAFHHEICLPLIKHRKKILCEKPLSHNLKTARKLHDLVQKNQIFFKCGSNFRNFPVVAKMVEMVRRGEIGKIQRLYGSIGHNGDIVRNKWNCSMEVAGGGTLLDNGIHLVDLFQNIAGEFITSDFIKKESLKNGMESYAVLKCTTKEVSEIFIESSWRKQDGYATVLIEGSRGRISGNVQRGTITFTHGNSFSENIVLKESSQSMDLELDYFIGCIQNNIQPEPSTEAGLMSLEKIFMAYENLQ